jgi:hypothetical protein
MVRPPTKSQRKNVSEEDSRMLLKYELLGLAVLYVVWTIFKAVMDFGGPFQRSRASASQTSFTILQDDTDFDWRGE